MRETGVSEAVVRNEASRLIIRIYRYLVCVCVDGIIYQLLNNYSNLVGSLLCGFQKVVSHSTTKQLPEIFKNDVITLTLKHVKATVKASKVLDSIHPLPCF